MTDTTNTTDTAEAPAKVRGEPVAMLYLGAAEIKAGKLSHVWTILDDDQVEKRVKADAPPYFPTFDDGREVPADLAQCSPLGDWRNKPDSLELASFSKSLKPGRPGMVWRFRRDGDTFIYSGQGVEYLGQWSRRADVIRWNAEHQTIVETHRRAKAEKAERSRIPNQEALQPFRDAYARLGARERRVFLADLMEFITRGAK